MRTIAAKCLVIRVDNPRIMTLFEEIPASQLGFRSVRSHCACTETRARTLELQQTKTLPYTTHVFLTPLSSVCSTHTLKHEAMHASTSNKVSWNLHQSQFPCQFTDAKLQTLQHASWNLKIGACFNVCGGL